MLVKLERIMEHEDDIFFPADVKQIIRIAELDFIRVFVIRAVNGIEKG